MDLQQFFDSPMALYTLVIIPIIEILKDWRPVQALSHRLGSAKVLRGLSVALGLLLSLAARAFGVLDMSMQDALIFGVSAGLVNTGLAAFAKKFKPQTEYVSVSSEALELSSETLNPWASAAGLYALELIKKYIPLQGIEAAKTMMLPFVMPLINVLLTDDHKRALRIEVQAVARKLKIVKSTGETLTTSLLFVGLTLLLSACSLLQSGIANTVNYYTADGASVTYIESPEQCYALFDSGESASLNTVAWVEGVTPLDPADNCLAAGSGFYCEVGEQTLHKLEYGCGVAGSITYEGERADGTAISLVLPN